MEQRTDSNHRRTGIYPTPSTTESTLLNIYCRHGALPPIWKPCLPTDFAFRSSRAANYALHRLTMLHGELSATSPAHHRMAINHLLHRLIYDALLRTRCHTEGKYDYYSKSCGRSYLPFCKGFPLYLILKSVGKSATNLRGALSFRVKDLSLLALYIGVLWCILSEDVHQHYRSSQ